MSTYMPRVEEGRTKVNHLHVHIWPRKKDDALYREFLVHERQLFKNVSEEYRSAKEMLKEL